MKTPVRQRSSRLQEIMDEMSPDLHRLTLLARETMAVLT
jgi:hypothetical protein